MREVEDRRAAGGEGDYPFERGRFEGCGAEEGTGVLVAVVVFLSLLLPFAAPLLAWSCGEAGLAVE